MADLKSVARLVEIFGDVVRRGTLGDSEANRLRFVAMAGHALRLGKRPCALFASNVINQRWLVITLDEEDAAREQLKAHDGEIVYEQTESRAERQGRSAYWEEMERQDREP